MTPEDKAWLMGVIFIGLGIAADKIVLQIVLQVAAIIAFLAGSWIAARDKGDTEEDTDGR